jgi:hypothetical protein
MSEAAMAHAILASGMRVFTTPAHCPLYPQGTLAPSSCTHALAAAHAHASNLLVARYRPSERLLAPANRPICNLAVRGPPSRRFS